MSGFEGFRSSFAVLVACKKSVGCMCLKCWRWLLMRRCARVLSFRVLGIGADVGGVLTARG